MMRKSSLILLATSAALALSACAKKAPETLPTPPADAQSAANRTPSIPAPPSGAGSASNQTPGMLSRPRAGSQADFVGSIVADRIFFDTDKSDVDEADKAALQSQASWLAKYPGVRVTIEGHCDERGTREYNLALGERRANAAKNYLASLGVDPARMTTISYGKERPAELGSDETAWAKNRRAVTVTVE